MKKFLQFVSMFLVLAIILPNAAQIIARATDTPTYISDVKIAYAADAASKESAKQSLINAGYTVVDSNLKEGTEGGVSYIGYKTTKDEKEAITDMAIMDMNGGYELNNYSATLTHFSGAVKEKAEGMMDASKEVKENYEKGSPAAMLAMQALNYMVVNEKSQALGDYLIDPARTQNDFYNIALKCDPNILIFIISQLSLGVADYQQQTWLEKYAQTDPNTKLTTDEYHTRAMILYPQFKKFGDRYQAAIKEVKASGVSTFGLEGIPELTESSSGEVASSEAAPDETSSNTAPSSAVTPSEATPSETLPSEATPSEALPSEVTPNEALPGEAVPNEAVPNEAVPGVANIALSGEAVSGAASSEAASSAAASSEAASSEAAPDMFRQEQNGEESQVSAVSAELMRTLTAYEVLNEYSYDDTGIGDILTDLISSQELYPLVNALTPGQFAMMAYSDIESFVVNLSNNTEIAHEKYAETSAKIEEAAGPLKGVDLWENTVQEVFEDKEIAMTSKAVRNAAAQNNLDAIARVDNQKEDLELSLQIVGTIATVAATVAQIAWGVMSIAFGANFAFSTLVTTISTTYATNVGGAFASAIFGGGLVVLALAVIALIVVAIFYLVDWIEELKAYNNPKLTEIPTSMFDYVEGAIDPENPDNAVTKYLGYEVVTDLNGNPADLNTKKGLKWNALYFTKDPIAGSPILADIIVRNGSVSSPEGYSPLRKFGEVVAFNVNANMRTDKVLGIYIFFVRKDGEKSPTKGVYLSDIVVRQGKTEADIMSYFKVKGYTPINVNIMPHGGSTNNTEYAYLGYKTTPSAAQAVRDIRVASNCNTGQVFIGKNSYGNAGTYREMTLYYSKMQDAGDPILAEFFATEKLAKAPPSADFVPISLLGGGPAANLALAIKPGYALTTRSMPFIPSDLPQVYMYYRSSVTYDQGPDYVSGIGSFYCDNVDNMFIMSSFMKEMGYTSAVDLTGNTTKVALMGFSTTKNKYRALRKVYVYRSSNNSITLPPFTMRDNSGYAVVPSFEVVNYSFYDRYLFRRESKQYIEIDQKNNILDIDATTGMYVTNDPAQGEPFTMNDIYFINDYGSPRTGYYGVANWNDPTLPVNLLYGGAVRSEKYMYIAGKVATPAKYISNLIVGASEHGIEYARLDLFNLSASEIERRSYDTGYFYPDGVNRTRIYTALGFARSNDRNFAITNIKVVAYDYNKKPLSLPEQVIINKAQYRLASQKPFAYGGYYRGFYLYYTTNPSAGDPITDVRWLTDTYFLPGHEAIGYLEDPNIMPGCTTIWEIADEGEESEILYVKRERTADAVYLKNIDAIADSSESNAIYRLASSGFSFIGKDRSGEYFDMNDSNGGDYIFLGYNKTYDKDDSITGLIASIQPQNSYRQGVISRNGINYAPLVSFTNFNSDSTTNSYKIYMYYTKDPRAGSPITDILCSFENYESGWECVLDTAGAQAGFNAGDYNCDPYEIYLFLKRANGVVSNRPSSQYASVFFLANPTTAVVILAILLSTGVALVVYQKRRRRKAQNKNV